MKKIILAASVAACAIAAQANAQSANFTGPRVQLDAGYDQLDANDDYPDLPRHFDTAYLAATLGYDVAIAPGIVAGAEVGFGKPLGGSRHVALGSDALTVSPGREWTGAVRLGANVTPSTLLFGTAGYSNAGISAVFDSPGLPGGDRTRIEGSKGGFLWGVGAEQAIAGKAFASLAFRSAHYGNYNYQHGVKRTQIRLGLGVRF
ncbi:outer membrane beta-barrel protein [Sphingomonas psychrotolerans]|uniref:Outer membrane beta-barrel protein n=1 Tax=Sphingomonas psychrotolerans TaxID=1327635 RepID=A0ABU3N604_9SPHN|nr:outer membrane beta-barrel protein [Sphingomonas psychrotolerans]MDT8758765.1 outer membrane beta-barrel protein [Sphingomonas psychrotolerans]